MTLSVADDGCGFDPAARRLQSFGLLGLNERAVMLGGSLQVRSAPDEGTTIISRSRKRPRPEGESPVR